MNWEGTVVYQRAGWPIWRVTALLVAAVMIASFTSFRQTDVPAEVDCTGQVTTPLTLRGARVAQKIGQTVRAWQQPIPEDEIRYTLTGMWRVIQLWFDSFHSAANGLEPPTELVELETEQSRRQAEATDGCLPCPTNPGEPESLGQVTAPVDAVLGARFGATGSWARYHTGDDYRAGHGTPVKTVAAGKVVFAGSSNDWAGNHVAVQHPDGYTTMYSHLSRIDVTVGQQLPAGTQVGAVGSTGRSFGPHLHFEVYPPGVKFGDVYKAVDPQKWLQKAAETGQAPPVAKVTTAAAKGSRWDREQLQIGAEARAVATKRRLPDDAVIIIYMTGLVESEMHQQRYLTIGSGDRDSQGWLQQRSSSGWGTPAQLRSSAYQAGKFFDALSKIQSWQSKDKGAVAQTIQVSAFPEKYALREKDARDLFKAVANRAPSTVPEAPTACQEDPQLLTSVSTTTGGVRTVTDPTSNRTYRIPIPAGKAGVAVNYALDQLGKPYVWASSGPDGFDCSGLVSAAWKQAGEDVYPQTEVMVKQEKHVQVPEPGDLLYKPGHVQMYLMTLGSGKQLIVEAPRPGKKIRVTTQWMNPTAILRPAEQGV